MTFPELTPLILHLPPFQLETGASTDSGPSGPEWTQLCALVKDVRGPPVALDGTLLATSLSFRLLAGAGVVKGDDKVLKNSMTKKMTAVLFKQQKFNLLREETEGYSKLAVILGSLPMPSAPSSSSSATASATAGAGAAEVGADVSRYINQVLALIGHFDLDANR